MSRTHLDLYWIPLGAGTRVVRMSGKCYEALLAFAQRRSPHDLYHAALVATTSTGRVAVEVAPIPDRDGRPVRGVVGEGAVASRWLGVLRVFRYEVRRWDDGVIPDLAYAVDGPVCLTDDPDEVQRVLDLVPLAPTPVWGRDELRAGEMWNSNSFIAWLLARAGIEGRAGEPPEGGRAPGWNAGLAVAHRSDAMVAMP